MSFEIEIGELPGNVSEFTPIHGHPIRAGMPALVIRHPSGPWTTAAYDGPLENAPDMERIATYWVGDFKIEVGTTTTKGSTVQPDGTVVEWVRPAIAYYPADIGSFGSGETERAIGNDAAVYLYPEHEKKS